jgi:hypothetical protein
MTDGPVENTDRDLWREREGDYHSDRIFVTKDGGIGMDVGGHCIVMPICEWFAIATGRTRVLPDRFDESKPPVYLSTEVDKATAESLNAPAQYPDPTHDMLTNNPLFDAIWHAIKGWDISRHNDGIYSGPTGNDARHVYDAIKLVAMGPTTSRRLIALKPGELPHAYALFTPPEGYRLETDDEFRARLLGGNNANTG